MNDNDSSLRPANPGRAAKVYALETLANVKRMGPTMIPATHGMEGNASAPVLYMAHAPTE